MGTAIPVMTGGALGELSKLSALVAAFMDNVTVNCEDKALRAARVRLLQEFVDLANDIADFSKIEK